MSTSFVVVPPNPFGAPYYVERLNHHFALHDDFEVHQIAVAVGCGLHEAQKLCDFLERLGYVERLQRTYRKSEGPRDYYKPKLPIQFVNNPLADFFERAPRADARKQFAGEGRR